MNAISKDREFAATIRRDFADDGELRASLKEFGWHRELPGIKDEHGSILIGNRRMRLCAELKIEPAFRTITFGDGSEADAERLKLALLSNVGGAPFTPKDRQRIAEHLYGERGWVMERIGQALGVSKSQISNDLAGFPLSGKPSRPKGGRPKSSKPRSRSTKPRDVTPDKEAAIAHAVLDEGKTREQAAREFGFSVQVAKTAVAKEEGRREAQGTVDPATLSISAKEKFDAAIRQEKKRLQAELQQAITAGIRRALEEGGILEAHREQIKEAELIIKSRKGVMSMVEYRLVQRCVHPDQSASKETHHRAFLLLKKYERVLVAEAEMPTNAPPLPSSYDELMKAREAVRARRRAAARKGMSMQRRA